MIAVKIAKRITDGAMIILLPLLMAEILTGQQLHEWLGALMAVCFIVHLALNFSWFKNIFKGNFSPARCLMTALNLLLTADILALLVSGIMMSGFVFSWLPISGGMLAARQLHLFASYWGLILMSAHLGLNFGGILSALKIKDPALIWTMRAAVTAASIYGIYAFISQKIPDYLFMKTHFVFFDESKAAAVFILETAAMIVLFAAVFYYLQKAFSKIKCGEKSNVFRKISAFAVPAAVCVFAAIQSGGQTSVPPWEQGSLDVSEIQNTEKTNTAEKEFEEIYDITSSENAVQTENTFPVVSDNLLLIKGGSFQMGSPENEPWRSDDEVRHSVAVSDFYISPYEVTQKEYAEIMGENPSNFNGENLPVENVSWLDAVNFCNALSERNGLTPVYKIEDGSVSWDRSANGYRLPTEAEWEYACRAGTSTPFNTENSPGAEEANYYGHYPYEIENNYFSQDNLDTKPGEYRQTTVAVDSFSPNKFGLYNMHGNVGEWVWDGYGDYDVQPRNDPVGSNIGDLRVYRGGGWNDFAKNMRSAYRAAISREQGSFNIGIRLVRSAAAINEIVSSSGEVTENKSGGKILIAYFSWGGNTRGVAEEIQSQTGADIFEIELVNPYSSDYNTVLDEAQRDQNAQARPEILNRVDNMEQYDTVLIGYPK